MPKMFTVIIQQSHETPVIMDLFDCLKGASHEIEMDCIWYQKKDLEKLELCGLVILLTDVHLKSFLQIMHFSGPFLHSNLFQRFFNAAEQFFCKNIVYRDG